MGAEAAASRGLRVIDLDRLTRGMLRFVDADGYHWPRHVNVRLLELVLAHIHGDLLDAGSAE